MEVTRARAAGAMRGLASFVVPTRYTRAGESARRTRVCAIVPTYMPSELTLRLVQDLVRFEPRMRIFVVDDSSPTDGACSEIFSRIKSVGDRVVVLRTSENKLKAGALNHALAHIKSIEGYRPDIVLTVDDDVVIERGTVRELVREVMTSDDLGAVCSQCRVFNKNANLLTRLQGLEYVGFNAIRLADEGFLRGPLVMHGMLTAFRAEALFDAGGYCEGHLIEDYEITSRLKARGWRVKSAQGAPAWTVVPETFSKFWRQRTRWSYGGVTVVAGAQKPATVFQDILGHVVFLATVGLILLLLFSAGGGVVPLYITQWIIGLSLLQLGVWYAFQLWLMRFYRERDALDWLIRASLIPEFIYSYVMTFALVGSYLFLAFNALKGLPMRRGGRVAQAIGRAGTRFFRIFGYTERRWGTRPVL